MTTTSMPVLTKKDFQTDQEVRWCPGCGDYAILSAVQSVFPELGIPRAKFVVISGIGCSSRFPYDMNTFGFHTIHVRGPAVQSPGPRDRRQYVVRGPLGGRLPATPEGHVEENRRAQGLGLR